MLDDLCHQIKGGLSIDLRGEGFIGVQCLWVGDGTVVDLVEDVLQVGEGGRGINTLWRLATRPLQIKGEPHFNMNTVILQTNAYASPL